MIRTRRAGDTTNEGKPRASGDDPGGYKASSAWSA